MTRKITTLTGVMLAAGCLLCDAATAAGLSRGSRLVCDAPLCFWDNGICTNGIPVAGAPDFCLQFTTQLQCESAGSNVGDGVCPNADELIRP